MIDLHPAHLKVGGKSAFVILTYEEYRRIQEALDDTEDLAALRAARRGNKRRSTYTIEAARRAQGLKSRRRTRARP